MLKSRRDFLRSVGIGAAAEAAVRWPLGDGLAAYAYKPARAQPGDALVRLNSNENPYGPSAKVAEAIRSVTGMANRYAFAKDDEVRERIASFHNVKPEQVLFGCGSMEILRVAACAFLGNGRQLMQAIPTFEAIEHYAKSVSAGVISVPLDPNLAHDLDSMRARMDASTGLLYICNPNNPTATLTPRKDLEGFIAKLPSSVPILIDEAYHQYAGESGAYASFIDHPVDDDRVIVTRTFSKVFGLAGLRLGYAVAAPSSIEKMHRFATENSLNAIMAEVVGVALDDTDGVRMSVKRNTDDRQEFHNQAMLRMLSPIDSHANFIMMNTQHPADEVIEHFRKNNILIGRHFPTMPTYVRVSLGTPEEMHAFWHTWDLLPWAKKFMHH